MTSPDSIGKPIRLVYVDDKYLTLDNRRLYAFQQANLNDVPVEIVDRADPLIQQMLAKKGRMNPIGGEGRTIEIATKAERSGVLARLRDAGLIR